jgi:hypothetical protein
VLALTFGFCYRFRRDDKIVQDGQVFSPSSEKYAMFPSLYFLLTLALEQPNLPQDTPPQPGNRFRVYPAEPVSCEGQDLSGHK